ncbi:hypothetical protein EDB19DRAFT_921557 [Suillus lakei]|nr:hypothetical protein EDB19DRAFT_921557 [Suillus lakei]
MADDTQIQKTDQVAHRFYTKLCLVVSNARATSELKPQSKVDKWFNLETPNSDLFRDYLRKYKAVSVTLAPPPFELQVLLSVPDCTSQVLVCTSTQLPGTSYSRIGCSILHLPLQKLVGTNTPMVWRHPPCTRTEYLSSAISTVYFVFFPHGSFTRTLGGAQAMHPTQTSISASRISTTA